MSCEVKDPKIKLFGMTIQLPETTNFAAAETGRGEQNCGGSILQKPCSLSEESDVNGGEQEQELSKCRSGPKQTRSPEEDQAKFSTPKEFKESDMATSVNEGSKMVKVSDIEEENHDDTNSQEGTLKKPDKIVPCPRCKSMETKFCYFNNYNVNQPRHFCRNCQRYWTAGGTMRNVPIGAGRRRYKHVPPQYRRIGVPESLTGGQIGLSNRVHHPALNPSGNVLGFRSVTPLCESMVSGLSMADKTVRPGSRNGFHHAEESKVFGSKEDGDNHLSKSSPDEVGTVGSKLVPKPHPIPSQMPGFMQAPWPYPFYPTFAPARFPVPFYPTGSPPYRNCTIPGSWNIPLVIPPIQSNPSPGPNSPTLGKHSRDDNILKLADGKEGEMKNSEPEKCLWVPKTIRIDDPSEAAKSSLWATLGIHEKVESGSQGDSLCKAFQSKSKGDEKAHVPETSTVLQANPAALSRSLIFHESS